MNFPVAIFCGSALLLAACHSPETLRTPEFDVAVELSDAALATLRTLRENVTAIAVFDGDSERADDPNAPLRAVYLGTTRASAEPGALVHVGSVAYSPAQRARLRNGEFHLTLNVVSGRRAAGTNLLRCSAPDRLLGDAHAPLPNPIRVRCALIEASPGV